MNFCHRKWKHDNLAAGDFVIHREIEIFLHPWRIGRSRQGRDRPKLATNFGKQPDT